MLFIYVFLAESENAGEGEDDTEAPNLPEQVSAVSLEDAGDADEKKKKKKKNKSKGGKGPGKEQTHPPTIPIAELYPDSK